MHVEPLRADQRIAIIDILRGWALLSVIVVNFAIFYSFRRVVRIPADDTLSQILHVVVQVLFQSKGWTMLAFLFGYGFSVLIRRIEQKKHNPALYFSRRMFWLLMIAIANCAFYYGDVLKDYAIVGMVILIFRGVSARAALKLSAACLIAFPALLAISESANLVNPIAEPRLALYQSGNLLQVLAFGLLSGLRMALSLSKYFDWNLVMLGCGFAGVYTHRTGILEDLNSHHRLIVRLCLGSLLFALATAGLRTADGALNWNLDHYYDFRLWPLLGQMMFFMTGLCWLYSAGKLVRLSEAMRTVGRMTLTNYMVQNLAALLIFSGFGLGLLYRMPYSAHVIFALAIFTVQMFVSRWWLAHHRFGPVEWLWRRLSNGPGEGIRRAVAA